MYLSTLPKFAAQVYGAVTMNNTMCLGVFLFVVYLNKLDWTYSAKVLGLLIPIFFVGVLGTTGRHLRAIWAFPILALYPLSLLVVYEFDKLYGTA